MFSTPQSFYYSGFCAGEMSCSVLKMSNKGQGYYYTPDVTVANSDKFLLQQLNVVIAQGKGHITSIKGGYNLSMRGKERVNIVLSFFERYPFITGDIVNSKMDILRKAVSCLSEKKQSNVRSSVQEDFIEECRAQLQEIKKTGLPRQEFASVKVDTRAIGYFLCGVSDAEGSVGLKKSRDFYQPYFAVAMKDKKIIYLFQDFLGCGSVYFRPESGVYHYETASFQSVVKTVEIFSNVYPSRQQHMKERLEKLKGILNDHTRGTEHIPIYYDGRMW